MGFKSTGNTNMVIYVKFNDEKAGKITMQRDSLARQSSLMSTEKVETSFPIRKKINTPKH